MRQHHGRHFCGNLQVVAKSPLRNCDCSPRRRLSIHLNPVFTEFSSRSCTTPSPAARARLLFPRHTCRRMHLFQRTALLSSNTHDAHHTHTHTHTHAHILHGTHWNCCCPPSILCSVENGNSPPSPRRLCPPDTRHHIRVPPAGFRARSLLYAKQETNRFAPPGSCAASHVHALLNRAPQLHRVGVRDRADRIILSRRNRR